MNKWISFFDAIYVINLNKREDRLLQITEDFEKYEIPFERITAIENDKGAEGLKDTMVKIFNDSIEKNHSHILVFEDDCKIIVDPKLFHDSMNKVTEQVPENYIMCFLGCQLSGRISHFPSPNIISASKLFSTHSVMYSNRGMKIIIGSNLQAPIDNHYVANVEPLGCSYCTFPLLTSQYTGYSDIGKNVHAWDPFITPRFQQKLNEFKMR